MVTVRREISPLPPRPLFLGLGRTGLGLGVTDPDALVESLLSTQKWQLFFSGVTTVALGALAVMTLYKLSQTEAKRAYR
jgi:hypothetical protein